jgi:hypothetical protein
MKPILVHDADELGRACAMAQPGDVIGVVPGLYDKASVLHKRGAADRPIVIRAIGKDWISGGRKPHPRWGGDDPSKDAPRKPRRDDFAFLIIDDCQNIIVDGLMVKDCWPSILFIKDSGLITVRNCQLRDATYAIFAKTDPTAGASTRGYLIEGNSWQQDGSADHRLWSRYSWEQAHGGEGSDGRYRYFNGAFVGAKGIEGRVVVRRNLIMDAFNGIRMKADDATRDSPDLDPVETNAHVHVYDNDFVRIRDNPIEPEVYALDWHVRLNRLVDCYSWFSFDGVKGGHWYFYGNTGWFQSRQGQPGRAGHTMGRVLKELRDRGGGSGLPGGAE